MSLADPAYTNRELRSRDPLHPSQPLMTDPGHELPEHATPSRLGHIPVEREHFALHNAAESVGSALGRAFVSIRDLPGRAKQRFTVIRGRKHQEVRAAADEAIARIRDASLDLKQEARSKFDQARRSGIAYAHQNPLQIVAGAAVFGMVMGIGLRLWRDHASQS